MRYAFITIFLMGMIACNQKTSSNKNEAAKIEFAKDTVPEIRSTINKKPVASYTIPMGDPRLDRKFGVNIYETPHTFKYLLQMQYDGMIQTDTLKVPNLNRWPVVKVEPGKEKLSCIIGFLDDKNTFREYKLLSAKNNHLNLSVLKSYGLVSY